MDDDPATARARAALAVVGEPAWQPHVTGFEFAAELAEPRSRTGSAGAFAAALPDRWVDRLAIVGTPERGRRVGVRACWLSTDAAGAANRRLAEHLRREATRSALLHTDDLAWHEPLFGWGDLLVRVLEPLHRGEPVRFQPPGWAQQGRQGAIEVPGGLDLVIVEGTGANQREVTPLVDAAIWVQADFGEAERRGIERDVADGSTATWSKRSRSGATGWRPRCASSTSSGRGNEPT